MFYYKLDLYLNYFYFNMISICISVFEFLQLTVVVKSVPLQPHSPKYFSLKTANSRKWQFLSTVGQISKFNSSREPQTLYMPPWKKSVFYTLSPH